MNAYACSTLLDRTLASMSGGTIPPFQREHIFYDILTYCKQGEPLDGQLDMMHHHSTIRKLVASIRVGGKAQIQHWLAQCAQSTRQPQTETGRAGIAALYYPAVALQAYHAGDYDGAQAGLAQAMTHLRALYHSGFKLALVAMSDQVLNQLRAHMSFKQHDAALDTACALIDFLYDAPGGELFGHARLADSGMPAHDRAACANHYTDQALQKILASGNAELIAKFADHLQRRSRLWPDGDVRQALQLLAALQHGQQLAPDTEVTLWKLPHLVRAALLMALLHAAGGNADDARRANVASILDSSLLGQRDAEAVRTGLGLWVRSASPDLRAAA